MAILDQWGRPVAPRENPAVKAIQRAIARYDAAQNGPDTRKHWMAADSSGPMWANRHSVRKVLRERARYECQNNSYASGLVRTIANHTIGTGPRLQVTGPDREINQLIEQAWTKFTRQINLNRKLATYVSAKIVDGEAFAILEPSPNLRPVPLDVVLVEADRFHDPVQINLDENYLDGVTYDAARNPIEYRMLKHHPGEKKGVATWEAESIRPERVCHYYRAERPGQVRGVPDLTPSLELFAILRKFTRATLAAAEIAALFAAFLKTTSPGAVGSSNQEPFAQMEIERGTLTSLPDNVDVTQLKPEHPSTTYPQFVDKLLQEIGRCLSVPFNILACNSSGYNFSSGRLDHQLYYRAIRVEQQQLEAVLLDRVFDRWFDEMFGHLTLDRSGYQPSQLSRHVWYWDPPEAIDPEGEAAATEIKLRTGQTTLARVWAAEGLDLETQMAAGAATFGVTVAELQRGIFTNLYGAPGTPSVSSTVLPPRQRGVARADMRAAERLRLKAAKPTGPTRIKPKKAHWLCGSLSLDTATEGATKPTVIVAYTGAAMNLSGFDLPVVVDYSGLTWPTQKIPLLVDHENAIGAIAGQSSAIAIEGGNLIVRGRVLLATEAGKKVVDLALGGFDWGASIGADVTYTERVANGQSVTVNGRTFEGPLIVAREAELHEVSFVALGADPDASADITAKAGGRSVVQGGVMKTFEEWLVENQFDPATISESQRSALMMAYEAWNAQQATPEVEGEGDEDDVEAEGEDDDVEAEEEKPAVQARKGRKSVKAGGRTATRTRHVTAARQKKVAERKWLREVERLTASHPEIGDRAIEAGWTAERTELEVRRATAKLDRPAAPGLEDDDGGPQILEAALAMQAGVSNVDKHYGDKLLSRAEKRFSHRGIGIQELLIEAAALGGERVRRVTLSNLKRVLRAAFSNSDIPGILSNVAGKSLLEGFVTAEQVWRQISRIKSVRDFKEVVSFRLITGGRFQKVGPTGELKHVKMSEEGVRNQADTYGAILEIPRQTIINDDLSAISDQPFELGNLSGISLNEVFWAIYLANSAFFTTARGNLVHGTEYALSPEGLEKAVLTFRNMKHANGAPLGMLPKKLLVPVELDPTAMALYTSELFNTGGSSTKSKVPSANIFRNKYEPLSSAYLGDSAMANASTTAWYLFGDPALMPAMEVVFLEGKEEPTVETADADFDVLGISMRAYLDFGCALSEWRGGVKMTGVAAPG